MKKIVLLCLSGVLVNNLLISGVVVADQLTPFADEISADVEAVIHKANYLLNGAIKVSPKGISRTTRPPFALTYRVATQQEKLKRATEAFEDRRRSFRHMSELIDPKHSDLYYNQEDHHQLISNVNKSASDLSLTKEGCEDAKITLSWLGDDLDAYSNAASKPPSSASWLGMSTASSMSQSKNKALQAAASAGLQRKLTYKDGDVVITAMTTATKCLDLAKKILGRR